jgi:hypothetical protein
MERRSLGRPANGDTRACPHCAAAAMEFSERFRINGVTMPAWVCENPACPVKQAPARRIAVASPTSKSLVRTSKQVRANALRTIMKAKALVARTERRKRATRRRSS